MIFETKDNKVYEIECEEKNVCDKDSCHRLLIFSDGKICDITTQAGIEETFNYIRETYKSK